MWEMQGFFGGWSSQTGQTSLTRPTGKGQLAGLQRDVIRRAKGSRSEDEEAATGAGSRARSSYRRRAFADARDTVTVLTVSQFTCTSDSAAFTQITSLPGPQSALST